MNKLGLVAIGRNEGELLRQCLESAISHTPHIVYVDSGSTDNSIAIARSLDVNVVELNLFQPFTAGRARNMGFDYLITKYPHLELVQFVDGDCTIVDGWLDIAQATLEQRSELAIVCGRRRERYPNKYIYNQLCDLEWNTPIGEAKACGGDFMARVLAFRQVRGFDPNLIAGEEPELCIRLRQQGWKILRVDAEMTLHDAKMSSIKQWWQRALRGGYAYAEGSWLYGKTAERHWVKESRSILFWGLVLPLLAIALLVPTHNLSLVLLCLYLVAIYRVYLSFRQSLTQKNALIYAIHCVTCKFPQTQGQLRFHWQRFQGQQGSLIEYKL